jgi:hypothetical protein
MEALILVTTLGGPTMFVLIGVPRAQNRHVERVSNPPAKILIGAPHNVNPLIFRNNSQRMVAGFVARGRSTRWTH